ncbi:10032_t:CDS:2 [Ambispora leptoticha]|uniref:10032_t:CDS:1 n=1 Tax=Ambispora leptoticha TaxID=144679 RepID=A0A9N8WC15_9GLOM|nr:10032_t:CDS:2 [Ambispora leptoticha]
MDDFLVRELVQDWSHTVVFIVLCVVVVAETGDNEVVAVVLSAIRKCNDFGDCVAVAWYDVVVDVDARGFVHAGYKPGISNPCMTKLIDDYNNCMRAVLENVSSTLFV